MHATTSYTSGERAGHLKINLETIRNNVAGLIDVDEWIKHSRENATVDLLQETGEHETYLWQTFRERVKA